MALAFARTPLEARLDRLYDDAAAYVGEVGGMSWTEFWDTPVNRLGRYARALERKYERERRQAEQDRRR